MGLERGLTVGEITGQVVRAVGEARRASLPPVTNVVFMGMGEPLMNWKSVDRALTVLNDPTGLGIGARHITISTVGLPVKNRDTSELKECEALKPNTSKTIPTAKIARPTMLFIGRQSLIDGCRSLGNSPQNTRANCYVSVCTNNHKQKAYLTFSGEDLRLAPNANWQGGYFVSNKLGATWRANS
jgi:hypothetical protein